MVAVPGQASASIEPWELESIDASWRAANYLSVGQIYLRANPLLREPLRAEHVKRRLLGHWGTTPGLNFIYAHLNRLIRRHDLDMMYVCGPGHGGPGIVAHTWLEGSYSELCPDVPRNAEGMERLFRQFSYPGGIGSHVTPEVPGSIHEGGELGYSLAHAYGAALDNPELIVACIIGDGEAETGPLAAAWHSNKFLDPAADGAVLPILHLNGYKIANPTILARIPREELEKLLLGYGYRPIVVDGDDPGRMHPAMAVALEDACRQIRDIQTEARRRRRPTAPQWPVIVLRSPKGWTGPAEVDGAKVADYWRSHQVPFDDLHDRPERLELLESWLRSYRPETLFDESGAPRPELLRCTPEGERRMGSNPHANGGLLTKDLRLPDPASLAVEVSSPGAVQAEATRIMGRQLREVFRLNEAERNFRVMGPDETISNRLNAVFEVTNRAWQAIRLPEDQYLAPDGRVMEILSEHTCQGWLEGYVLTGRHGLFNCYEAFIHIVDSMFNQHAKWLDKADEVPWRKPIPSLNILLTSHVWRQDHNGFSHQDPGFIDLVMNKKPTHTRVYLPPDANTLLWVTDCCLRSRDLVNVIIAGKNPQPQWLSWPAAVAHCERGAGIFAWAGTAGTDEPDVVLACAGDVPTIETIAAADLLREWLPELRTRVVNVVDLMTLQPPREHPHGLTDEEFDALFTRDKPIVFAFHGYPWLIHRMTYRRTNHDNLHVRGYKEEGTTTTPFDMAVRNDLDRYHLVMDVVKWMGNLGEKGEAVCAEMARRRAVHREYIERYGEDLPEIREWRFGQTPPRSEQRS